MTEPEWLASADPQPMLQFLTNRAPITDRRLRLLQVASCYRIWDMLPNDDCRAAVVTAEQYADSQASERRRQKSLQDALQFHDQMDEIETSSRQVVRYANEKTIRHAWPAFGASAVFGFAARKSKDSYRVYRRAFEAERRVETDLVRCIFGNPFRPVALDPSWRTEAVVGLAAGIYADRAFDRLPVLADALEDAGCADPDVLGHCRSGGPHARGCWVVDLILGKA